MIKYIRIGWGFFHGSLLPVRVYETLTTAYRAYLIEREYEAQR